jgi:D-alanine-D-alanine ligase-like ATP-grasp enzyme
MADGNPVGLEPGDFHALCLQQAAIERGVPHVFGRLPKRPGREPRLWLRLQPGRRCYFYSHGSLRHGDPAQPEMIGDYLNGDAVPLLFDKNLTKTLLRTAGLSTPLGSVFGPSGLGAALAFFRWLGRPVCLKPNEGRKGELAFPVVRDEQALEAAFTRIIAAGKEVLVEESVPGEVVRFFYVRPRVVAIKHSRCASVVGDGRRSIAELIAAKNRRRSERRLPGHMPIVLDENLLAFLAGEGRALGDVPAPGQRVPLSATSNGATGADSIECAASTHPSYAALIEKACAVIPDLAITAADVMVRDRTAPATPDNYAILELNGSPGVLPYHFPWHGRPQDVSGAILDYLVRDAQAA